MNPLSKCLLIAFALSALVACHQRLAHPELSDPVYLDIKKDADTIFTKITQTQKDLAKARDDYDSAPIRTGLRQDALESYFKVNNDLELLIENYRYLVLKTELQRKYDNKAYELSLKNNKPWPDMNSFFEYQTQKRLAKAPREWNPDARIKERQPASKPSKESSSGDE
jgi:hypothetical protein